MFSNSLKTVVLRPLTATTPYFTLSRKIHHFEFTNKSILSTKPAEREAQGKKVFKFCGIIGLDALGANHADATGPAHQSQSDMRLHLTCKVYNVNGDQMIFYGGGKTWDRVHIPLDEGMWPEPGYYMLAGTIKNPNS